MPSSNARLQNKFMQHDEHGQCIDDGCARCERIIKDDGGTVHRGIILYSGHDAEVLDAIEYLVWEWDYAHEREPLAIAKVGTT